MKGRKSPWLVGIASGIAVVVAISLLLAGYVYFGVRPKEGWFVAHLRSGVLPDLYAIHGRWPTSVEIAARIKLEDEPLAHFVLDNYHPEFVDITASKDKFRATLKFRHVFGGSFLLETEPDNSSLRPFPLR